MSDTRPPAVTLVSPGVFRCPGWGGASQPGEPEAVVRGCDDTDERPGGCEDAYAAAEPAAQRDDLAGTADTAGTDDVAHSGADDGSAEGAASDAAGVLRDAAHNTLLDSVREGLVAEAQARAVRLRQLRELTRLSGTAHLAAVPQFPQLEMAGSWQVSQLTATRWSDEAERYELCLPQTLEALEVGALLVHQAQVLLHRTRHCTETVARAVENEVLPFASALCPSDLRKRVDRVVLRVESELADAAVHDDPDAVSPAEQRHAEAVADRHVYTRPELDGMATAAAVLTAEQSVAWKHGLDLLERRERLADRVAGLDRSAEQRRADLFAALPAMVLAGTALDRAASDSRGSADSSWASPCPCGRSADDGCCRAGFLGFTVDRGPSGGLAPQHDARPAAGPESAGAWASAAASGSAPCVGLQPWTLGPERIAAQVVVNVHVPMATVLDLSREPGTLQGHGPVSAEHVRLLRPQAFRKVLVDGATGKPLSVDDRSTAVMPDPKARREQLMAMLVPTVVRHADEPQHDPSEHLARLVDVRDAHCCGPGCSSCRTDRDHLQPWPAGPTAESNLGRLSRRCHRAKHHGWTLVRHGDGSSTWTSPLARTYDRPAPHQPPPRVDLFADPPVPRPAPEVPPPRWALGKEDPEGELTRSPVADTVANPDDGIRSPEVEPPF